MTRKQTTAVSPAASNTRVISATKRVLKLVVTNVRFGGERKKVKFIARDGMVVCRSVGLPKFVVRQDGEVFVAKQRGNPQPRFAATPSEAFASGVRHFWANA